MERILHAHVVHIQYMSWGESVFSNQQNRFKITPNISWIQNLIRLQELRILKIKLSPVCRMLISWAVSSGLTRLWWQNIPRPGSSPPKSSIIHSGSQTHTCTCIKIDALRDAPLKSLLDCARRVFPTRQGEPRAGEDLNRAALCLAWINLRNKWLHIS